MDKVAKLLGVEQNHAFPDSGRFWWEASRRGVGALFLSLCIQAEDPTFRLDEEQWPLGLDILRGMFTGRYTEPVAA